MRTLVVAILAAFAFATATDAQPHKIRAGLVTAIDDAGKTFTCHWQTSDWAYRTTGKTLYRIGGKAGSWSDLKVGETVQVTYHDVDKDRVADRVEISVP